MCKVTEIFVKDTILVEHFKEYNIIKGCQKEFTRGCLCLTDLLEFFEEVCERIDEGKLKDVDLIYLNFAKEFDKVPHKTLAKSCKHMVF